MSACSRCGAQFTCAMADGSDAPCWCTALPPALPVPVPVPVPVPMPGAATAAELPAGATAAACWCPACLRDHIAALERKPAGTAPA